MILRFKNDISGYIHYLGFAEVAQIFIHMFCISWIMLGSLLLSNFLTLVSSKTQTSWSLLRNGESSSSSQNIVQAQNYIGLKDRASLIELLEMAENAYHTNFDLPNLIGRIGYDDNKVKAKVFKYEDYIVLAIKGTTVGFFSVDEFSSAFNDRIMNNILFSCCSTADKECKNRKLNLFREMGYLSIIEGFLLSLKSMYPGKRIILTGHSLGGGIASLLGAKHGLLTISFSSPGVLHFAKSLGIYNESEEHPEILNIGLENDTIFRGRCGDPYSVCRVSGYVLQTLCHLGKVYLIKDYGMDSIINHPITALKDRLSSQQELIMYEFKETCNGECLY